MTDPASSSSVLLLNRDVLLSGGVARALLTYVRHHDQRRIRLTLACFQRPAASDAAEFGLAGTPVNHLGEAYAASSWRLRALLRRQRVDVIVCNSFKSFLVAKIASLGLRCRLVFWLHGGTLVVRGPVRGLLFRSLARSDTIVCVSEAVRRAHGLERHAGTLVIHHGIEDVPAPPTAPSARTAARAALGFEPEDVVIGYVASLTAVKDHETLLHAFAAALRRDPRLRLVLIGDGPLLPQLRALAATLGCARRTHFLGTRTDVRALFDLMDLYVHPGRQEGFGLAVAEALLAGLPVITSDDGALPEYVLHGTTGMTFPVGNARALAEALSHLADDPALAAALAREGQAQVRVRFSVQRFASRLTAAILEGRDDHEPHRAAHAAARVASAPHRLDGNA